MEYILGGLAVICTIVSAILLRAYAVAHAETRRASALGFVAGETTFPDAVIAEDAPLRVAVGAYYLHVSTFDCIRYGKFMGDFAKYLTAIKRLGISIEFLSIVDAQLEKVAADTVLATNKAAQAETTAFVARWLLADKRNNPHKISRKYFQRNVTPTGLLSLLYALKWYNMDTVKKKAGQIEAILTGTATSGTLSNGPAAPTGGASTVLVVPNFPNYSLWLAEEGKVLISPSEN